MIPGEQIKAARSSLGWTRWDLAGAAGVTLWTVRLAEMPGFGLGISQAMRSKVEAALEAAGTTFSAECGAVMNESAIPTDMPKITSEQIKAARKLLGWSAATLALKSRRTLAGVLRAESGTLNQRQTATSLRILKRTLEAAGVIFVAENGGGPGVRLRKG